MMWSESWRLTCSIPRIWRVCIPASRPRSWAPSGSPITSLRVIQCVTALHVSFRRGRSASDEAVLLLINTSRDWWEKRDRDQAAGGSSGRSVPVSITETGTERPGNGGIRSTLSLCCYFKNLDVIIHSSRYKIFPCNTVCLIFKTLYCAFTCIKEYCTRTIIGSKNKFTVKYHKT